jgi:O-antigen/teichoic acid export membrane protein
MHKLKNFLRSDFSLITLQSGLKVVSGLVIGKTIAVFFGPAGLALFGQLQNIIGSISILCNGSIQTGLIRGVAASMGSTQDRKTVISSAASIVIVIIPCMAVVTFFNKHAIETSISLLNNPYFIVILLLSIPFLAAHLNVSAILNGMRRISEYSFINITTYIVTTLAVLVGSIWFGISGAFIGLILSPIVAGFINVTFLYFRNSLSILGINWSLVSRPEQLKLLRFGLATMMSGLLATTSALVVRYLIIENFDITSAGLWEVSHRICMYFNLVVMLPVSVHFLPIFTVISDVILLKNKIQKLVLAVIGLTLSVSIIFFFGFPLIVSLLFSEAFLSAESLLQIALFGEGFRVLGMIFATLLFAKGKPFIAVKNEAIFVIFLLCLCVITFDLWGLQAVAFAYLLASITYGLLSYLSVRKYLK